MRVLFLSNFYPPARPGGYTQWCYEVAERLKARGHVIGVLTSNHQLEKIPSREQNIFRVLHLEGDLDYYQPFAFLTNRRARYDDNIENLRRVVEQFSPDLIFIWGMWAMSKSLPALAEKLMPRRVVYYVSDYWPASKSMHAAYWRSPAKRWYMRPPKRLLTKLVSSFLAKENQVELKFEHAICVSRAVRDILVQAALPFQPARIIHGGTDTSRFSLLPERQFSERPFRLLYAGQLVKHKGVHTAVEAVAKLVNERGTNQLRLTIVGSGHPDYEALLREAVRTEGLQTYVEFLGPLSRDDMPNFLREFHSLIFPSIYEEPLARMTQEGMAAGLVVVGTTSGGTKEILHGNENGLVFQAEDAGELANKIEMLLHNPGLCQRLSLAGHQKIVEYFNLDRMVDEIEAYLQDVMANSICYPTPFAVA